MKLYNVEIFERATGKTETVIGKNMTDRQASRRQATGMMRVNKDFGVRVVEVLSEADAEDLALEQSLEQEREERDAK